MNYLVQLAAQELPFIPVVREGVQWVHGMVYTNENKRSTINENKMTIEFLGDSIVNGVTYKKCIRTFNKADKILVSNSGNTFSITTEPTVIGLCREFVEDDKQYFNVIYTDRYIDEMLVYAPYVLPYNDNEVTVYRLDVNSENPLECFINDIKIYYPDYSNIFYNFEEKSTIEINGSQRYFMKYGNKLGGYELWTEGIGYDSWGQSTNVILPRMLGGVYYATELNHVVEEGKVVYKSPLFDENLVDVMSAIDNVQVNPIKDNRYYNLMGQPVSNPSEGIYIHNGKKVIVK